MKLLSATFLLERYGTIYAVGISSKTWRVIDYSTGDVVYTYKEVEGKWSESKTRAQGVLKMYFDYKKKIKQ